MVASLVLSLGALGCCSTQERAADTDGGASSTTPEGLKRELEALRDPSGIFLSPQALSAQANGSTALPVGDLNSTFTVRQIAPDIFTPSTSAVAALRMRLEGVPRSDRVLRARAIAAIQAFGGDVSTFEAELVQAKAMFEQGAVARDEVRDAVNLAEALRLVDVRWTPTLTLDPFPVSSEADMDLAVLVMTHVDLFTNRSAIAQHFATVAPRLEKLVAAPGEPLMPFYRAINALPPLQQEFDPATDSAINADIPPLQGCLVNGREFSSLFVSDMSPGRPCSLEATWLVYRSGYYPRQDGTT